MATMSRSVSFRAGLASKDSYDVQVYLLEVLHTGHTLRSWSSDRGCPNVRVKLKLTKLIIPRFDDTATGCKAWKEGSRSWT